MRTTDRAFTGVFAAFGFVFLGGVYIFAVSHGAIPSVIPCNNAEARAVAASLENPAEWRADAHHVTRVSDGLSIWYANNVYGLGIDRDGYAMPDDGGLSLPCRSLIYRTLYPRTASVREF